MSLPPQRWQNSASLWGRIEFTVMLGIASVDSGLCFIRPIQLTTTLGLFSNRRCSTRAKSVASKRSTTWPFWKRPICRTGSSSIEPRMVQKVLGNCCRRSWNILWPSIPVPPSTRMSISDSRLTVFLSLDVQPIFPTGASRLNYGSGRAGKAAGFPVMVQC